ncbi:hypothetical protein [Phytoactinopolyspora alkaliphila]|uniref:hypothetical protein n=1 Tax=Phytoactinopolyspora alkaliphila TaxID=1783498 RepID=UPI001C20BBE2|nr:hypothetical protein [Phytoactinopolyspora alkaliphila]
MPCYRCGAREADPGRGSRLWVRAVRADLQVLVCPECQQGHGWSSDVDHCPTCDGTNLVRRLGETVCRTCESSATAEFLAVESTMDRGLTAIGAGGRHRRPDDGRDLESEVATAIDRVLGKHAKRPANDPPRYPPEDDEPAESGDRVTDPATTRGVRAGGETKGETDRSKRSWFR